MRVNADSRSRHDVRYKRLARRLGVSHAEAYGRAIWVWFELYERAGAFMSAEDIDIAAEMDGFASAMVECELAEETPDGVRVRGNERAGWVEKRRETSSEGGRARAATALRKSGRFVTSTTKHQPKASQTPAKGQPSDQPHTSPPALAPALDQIRPQAALVLTPSEPEKPTPTPGSQLRAAFTGWYRTRYSAEYAWGPKEATHAKTLMDRAGENGVAEVMRRVELAAKQPWRKANVTLGTLVEAWNSLAADTEAAAVRPKFVGGNVRSKV